MTDNQKLALATAVAVGGLAAVGALSQKKPVELTDSGPIGGPQPAFLLGFDPTDTPTITPTPTRTSTPDATGHLPNPHATVATRTFPGDHYPTAVAWLQGVIEGGTPGPLGTAVPLYAEIWAPNGGDSFGALVRPTDIVGYIAEAGRTPQATPRVQGYFLAFHGTPDAERPAELIAIVTTFWNQATPIPFPTDMLWYDPTAQWSKVEPDGSNIGTDPLVFVLTASATGYQLVSVIEGKDGYDRVVQDMQDAGWGPYFSFKSP